MKCIELRPDHSGCASSVKITSSVEITACMSAPFRSHCVISIMSSMISIMRSPTCMVLSKENPSACGVISHKKLIFDIIFTCTVTEFMIMMTGAPTKGGRTSHCNESEAEVHSEDFQHGKHQIGPCEKICHAGEEWNGPRGTISFHVTRSIHDEFSKHGHKRHDLLKEKSELQNTCLK